MDRTDYIKAFTEAIEKADLENETVVRNLDNALVMASARYEGDRCVNIECAFNDNDADVFGTVQHPRFNFDEYAYRIKPEPQYKPFDVDSFLPFRDCWFKNKRYGNVFRLREYNANGVYDCGCYFISWEDFLARIEFYDGKPAGIEVCTD